MGEPAVRRFSYEEYLALEQGSLTKNEYFDGHILAMAGGTAEHGFLSGRMILELGAQLRGKPCAPHSSDTRIRVVATGLSTYPDVSVVCGKPERDVEDHEALTNPIVIVEVLSKSTEAYDRGEKFHQYRRIPSLQEYVLVSQGVNRIEQFTRTAEGWVLRSAGPGESLQLTSVGCVLQVDSVYEGVELYRE